MDKKIALLSLKEKPRKFKKRNHRLEQPSHCANKDAVKVVAHIPYCLSGEVFIKDVSSLMV